jgi:hypothetical protein
MLSSRLAVLAAIVCMPLIAGAAALVAADRPARVITPQGSPVWLDPQRSLLFDSPAVTVIRRNESTAPVDHALRIWVFDERSALRGTQDYCSYETLGRDTRSLMLVPLEIPGVTMRDAAVVTVPAAASDRFAWTLAESEAEQLDAARSAARGPARRLSLQRQEASPEGWQCPCDCAAQQAACGQRCGSGRSTASCTPMLNGGCSATCACM